MGWSGVSARYENDGHTVSEMSSRYLIVSADAVELKVSATRASHLPMQHPAHDANTKCTPNDSLVREPWRT